MGDDDGALEVDDGAAEVVVAGEVEAGDVGAGRVDPDECRGLAHVGSGADSELDDEVVGDES